MACWAVARVVVARVEVALVVARAAEKVAVEKVEGGMGAAAKEVHE